MTADVTLPEFREWSIAAVHLLHGVVYLDDGPVWGIVCSNRTPLELYFARIGLALIVDEAEGFAFLRQLEDDELGDGYDALPKLFHKSRLSYDSTLLCVLLRDELQRFEEEEIEDQRCVIKTSTLFELWKAFYSANQDEVKLMRALRAALNDLEELKFVRQFAKEPEEWEIRRILKARTPASKLESLLQQLRDAQQRRTGKSVTHELHE